jgi:predicted metal-dependent enzyme (double-stranded beta helix superfamily)
MSIVIEPLQVFCDGVAHHVEENHTDIRITKLIEEALRTLVQDDAWLPERWARPDSEHYQQHSLYRDPLSRFSVVSFVWGPGQSTPIHDHGVWGVVAVLRGAELSQRYTLDTEGRAVENGQSRLIGVGDTEILLPEEGDIHSVANAFDDKVSISIHVYGADIGVVRRRAFDLGGGSKSFVSSYSDAPALLAGFDTAEKLGE